VERDENNNLIITYTNGTVVNLGNIKGDKGENGEACNGIAKVELNENGELVITYTNGTSINLGNLKGDKGDQGEPGKDGEDGKDGQDGKDGDSNTEIVLLCIGIASLCLLTTIVAFVTTKGRNRWWILS
ncbi:MAG: collagen-like protein, partial [Clostridia bacterium]|nr:collagen-like protein [Clostridia bacterium]